jgi:hypothetical protein
MLAGRRATSAAERVTRGVLGAHCLGVAGAAVALLSACADVSTDPAVAASIEAAPLAFPSIAIGDSLRDEAGVAQPIVALARNANGEVIEDAPIRYLYLQAARDSALTIDSVTGHIVAERLPSGSPVQIAARFGTALQVLIPVRVSNAPDTVFRTDDASIVGFVPDTGSRGVDQNSAAVEVQVRYRDANDAFQNVGDWLVRFSLVYPENPSNDTTAAVFLIGAETARPSQLDTTASTGLASRRVRVRPALFPASGKLRDTVVVEARVFRRGDAVQGSPLTILVPVASPSTRGTTVRSAVSGVLTERASIGAAPPAPPTR